MLFAIEAHADSGDNSSTIVPKAHALRVPFIANHGQKADEVTFHTTVFGGSFFVTRRGELVHSFLPRVASGTQSAVITEVFLGADDVVPRGVVPSPTTVSFLKGRDRAMWQTGIATYQSVALANTYPGIDIELRKLGGMIEKLFRVRPGGDPSKIAVKVGGAQLINTTDGGELALHTSVGVVHLSEPKAYQVLDGRKRWISVGYRLSNGGYAFDVGRYDRRYDLVIDPLIQATYLGTSNDDYSGDIVRHPSTGDIYTVGSTPSHEFPGTAGGLQPGSGGGEDVFVARFNSELTALVQATFFGGAGEDSGYAIAMHPNTGDVYISGGTTSADLPGTSGAAQADNAGGTDAFVAHFSPNLSTLYRSTYFGGSDNERGFAVRLFASERIQRIYVAGDTLSDNLPGTADAPQPSRSTNWDAFAASFETDLSSLRQATYFGGARHDHATTIELNPVNSKVFIGGKTRSDNLPGTAEGAQSGFQGGLWDGFVAVFEPDVRALRRATYFGGRSSDEVGGIAIHPTSADVYITGYSESTTLAGTIGGAQPELAGRSDIFVSRLDPGLMSIRQSTYLGGDSDEFLPLPSIALNSYNDRIYIVSRSSSENFPGTTGGIQESLAGDVDAIVARLTSDLRTLEQATYLGGSSSEFGLGMTIDPSSGGIYVLGETWSSDFPGTAGGAQPTFAGARDVFVAHLDAELTDGYGWWGPPVIMAAFIFAMIRMAALLGRRFFRRTRLSGGADGN